MNKDTRVTDVLHVLVHMDRAQEPLTSQVLAQSMDTNPAVFRRTMAGLRNAGLVHSSKGRGGGWLLARPLNEITLLAVYEALGRPTLFAIGNRNRHPDCVIEKSVNHVMSDTMAAASALFEQRFGELTLDRLLPKEPVSLAVHGE